MACLTHQALTVGLITKIEVTRQDGPILYYKAHGYAPGQPRITFEAGSNPDSAVAGVLTRLASMSPMKSPRGDEAINLLRQEGYPVPERDKDPEPEPKPENPEVDGEVPAA